MFELVEELLGRQVLTLQRADEFQQILVRNDVGRGGREFSKKMVDQGSLQPVPLGGQVDHAIRRISEHVYRRGAAKSFLVDGGFEQGVAGSRDEEVKVRNGGKPTQCRRRREIGLLKDAAQSHVGLLATAASGKEPAHYVI